MFTLAHTPPRPSKARPALLPRMSEAERACFERYLAKATHYLEFGCGGSTMLAARGPAKKIWSVESDPGWIAKLRREGPIRDAIKKGRLEFFCPKLGDIGSWGQPKNNESRHLWHRYHSDVWLSLDAEIVDLVLVDGRFRVACTVQAALRVPRGCPILIHDFWSRSKYHTVLEFLKEIDRADTLGVFVPQEPRRTGKMLDLLLKVMSQYNR